MSQIPNGNGVNSVMADGDLNICQIFAILGVFNPVGTEGGIFLWIKAAGA
jgi:hypothetical protein